MAFRRSRPSLEALPVERDGQTVSLGMEHLSAIGEASASLGLISTLVFGICMSSIMAGDDGLHEVLHLFIALATSCSTYTTVYSLLEFYYVMMLKGVEKTMMVQAKLGGSSAPVSTHVSNRSLSNRSLSPVGSDSEMGLLDTKDLINVPKDAVVDDCVDMVLRIESAFAGFNEMRMWARNCMWCSLISLICAAIAKINPLLGHEPDLNSSAKTSIFFAGIVLFLLMATQVGFRSRDVWVFMTCCSVCGVLAAVISRYDAENEIKSTRIFSSLMLVLTIVIVPVTVKAFRFTFLPMAKERCDIY